MRPLIQTFIRGYVMGFCILDTVVDKGRGALMMILSGYLLSPFRYHLQIDNCNIRVVRKLMSLLLSISRNKVVRKPKLAIKKKASTCIVA